MKISFPKYGIDELLTQKRLATCIILFVALAVCAGALGSYLFGNKFWLFMLAVLGIAGILLLLGTRAGIFLNKNEVNETPSAPIEENVPQLTPQWNYRPRKARPRSAFDSPGTETSDGPSSDTFAINDNVWLNDNSLERVAPTLINDPPEVEEPIAEVLPQTSDPACASPTVDDEASEVRPKSHRQSSPRR